MQQRIIVALTGASGVIYGIRLVSELLKKGLEIHFIASEPALIVLEHELGWEFSHSIEEKFYSFFSNTNFYYYSNSDIAAKIASGSFITEAMVIIPCSMSTVASVATGMSNNLIERAADVILKEKRKLIIVPRETPLSTVHLKNLLTLAENGVHVIPAMPAFYNNPNSIEDMINFMLGKVMDAMRIPNNLYNRYDGF